MEAFAFTASSTTFNTCSLVRTSENLIILTVILGNCVKAALSACWAVLPVPSETTNIVYILLKIKVKR